MAWFEHGTGRVYYEDAGTGDAVLLTPGFSLNIDDVSALRDALVTQYRVIAADLPGSGRSGPQPREYTRTYHTDDARVLLALLESLGIERAHLIGHSDGGESSLVMAALDPKRVRSVLTLGSLGYVDESLRQLLDVFEVVVDEPIEPLRAYSDFLKATYGEDNARAMVRSFTNATRLIIADGGDIARARAKDIISPVMLIAGGHDPFAPPRLVQQFAGVLRNAEVTPLPDAGHDLHRTHADWLAETVKAWLTAH